MHLPGSARVVVQVDSTSTYPCTSRRLRSRRAVLRRPVTAAAFRVSPATRRTSDAARSAIQVHRASRSRRARRRRCWAAPSAPRRNPGAPPQPRKGLRAAQPIQRLPAENARIGDIAAAPGSRTRPARPSRRAAVGVDNPARWEPPASAGRAPRLWGAFDDAAAAASTAWAESFEPQRSASRRRAIHPRSQRIGGRPHARRQQLGPRGALLARRGEHAIQRSLTRHVPESSARGGAGALGASRPAHHSIGRSPVGRGPR